MRFSSKTRPSHRVPAAGLLLSTSFALAGCSGLSTTIRPSDSYQPSVSLRCEAEGTPFVPDAAILADAQLNNYYGARLFSSSLQADDVVRVAIRPPTLDLWSDVVLSSFVRETVEALRQGAKDDRAPLLLFLGDSTNIACTGEFQRFLDTMNASTRDQGASWLMVHGNHDSFMMGNFNSWGRPSEGVSIDVRAYVNETDEVVDVAHSDSQYTAAEGRAFAYAGASCNPGLFSKQNKSWAAACAEPGRESVPMYKGAWLRRYLQVLEAQGVQLRADGAPTSAKLGDALDSSRCAPPRKLEGRAPEGTALARRNYLLSGRLYPRQRVNGDGPCDLPQRDLNSYRSYIVQSLDLNDGVRAVLIDTDHRDDLVKSSLISTATKAAGSVGRMEEEQLEELADHVRSARSGQRIIFFAHHPLAELSKETRQRLMELHPLAYVSAHTHFESSVITHEVGGGRFVELNVGSTTDWPMEAALLGAEAHRLRWRVLGVREPSEVSGHLSGQAGGYQRVRFYPGAQQCAQRFGTREDYTAYKSDSPRVHGLCHLREELSKTAARWPGDRSTFVALDSVLGSPSSGKELLPAKTDWREPARHISGAVEVLRAATLSPGDARDFAVCEAVAASKAEAQTRGWLDEDVERSDTVRAAAGYSCAEDASSPASR